MNHVLRGAPDVPPVTLHVTFQDNALLPLLFGAHDAHLARIEHRLGVRLTSRGNRMVVSGPAEEAEAAKAALLGLYAALGRGEAVGGAEVDAAVRMARHAAVRALEPGAEEPRLPLSDIPSIRTRKSTIAARSPMQAAYMEALAAHELVFALGPAGTGKTYLAITKAVEALESGKVGRIVLSRPAVEAGESLGFLPGAMEDKLAPYLRPLYDALQDRLSPKRLKALMAEGLIEIAPVGFMRGRTLNNAFVVIDEAQNCTYGQIKMLLTRLGWNSTMVVTGDPAQTDLLPDLSGLSAVAEKLEELKNVSVVRLGEADIVRHPLVASMLGVL